MDQNQNQALLNQILLGNQPNIPNPPTPHQEGQGRRVLYLPNLLYAANNALLPGDCPLPGPHFPNFPYARPPGLLPSQIELPNLSPALRPLHPSLFMTTSAALTKTAPTVDALNNNAAHRLDIVVSCTSFWDNILDYASPNPIPARPNHLNTWVLPPQRQIPLPPPRAQARGVKALAGWYISQKTDEEIVVGLTSEPSVQDAAVVQIITPLNHLLKTRYMPGTLEHTGFPQWGRSCSKLHLTRRKDNAGYPDFLLRRSDSDADHAAVAEAKTWWTYTDELFEDLFQNVNTVSGRFARGGVSNPSKFLKQVWGELHFFQSKLGFVTNGRHVMLFAKSGSGNNNNTLIVSLLRAWDDPSVLQGLAGITFAATDSKYLDVEVLIDQYLCPQVDRQPHWPPGGHVQRVQVQA